MPEKGQLWPDEDDPVRHEEVGGGLTRIPAAAIVVVVAIELPGAVGFIRWTPIGRFRGLTFRHVQRAYPGCSDYCRFHITRKQIVGEKVTLVS